MEVHTDVLILVKLGDTSSRESLPISVYGLAHLPLLQSKFLIFGLRPQINVYFSHANPASQNLSI